MKKFLLFIGLTFLLSGCNQVPIDDNDENNGVILSFYDGDRLFQTLSISKNESFIAPSIQKNGYFFEGWFKDESFIIPLHVDDNFTEDTAFFAKWLSLKELALEDIQSYKTTLMAINGDSNQEILYTNPYINLSDPLYTKEDTLPYLSSSVGVDLEWIDMSLIVLEFTELFLNTDYEINTIVNYFDVLNDASVWGWHVDEETQVIINYIDEVLYLRVIQASLIQTFYFNYNEDGLMQILRLYETNHDNTPALYIEDFLEETGLSFWSSSGYYSLYFTQNLNERYYVFTLNQDHEISFSMANVWIDNVPLLIQNNDQYFSVIYDLYQAEFYDSFTSSGVFYKDDKVINSPYPITLYSSINHETSLTHYRIIIERFIGSGDSLSIFVLGLETSLTYEQLDADVSFLLENFNYIPTRYDYTQEIESILTLLESELYLDYSEYFNEE